MLSGWLITSFSGVGDVILVWWPVESCPVIIRQSGWLRLLGKVLPMYGLDFPGGSVIKGCSWQCRRCRFDPWVEVFPWIRKWLLTPVFLPGKSHRQRSLAVYSSTWG